MASQKQKQKLLCTMQILMERSDENHILSAADLIRILENEYDLKAERKSIYQDIEALQEYGLDIIQVRGKKSGYYIASRQFELPELKLLVDVVQSAKFITERKSMDLIKKLERLASRAEAKQLNRQVVVRNRPKTGNETIYYNVDAISEAIANDTQIQYKYHEWTTKKELKAKRNGELYTVSPWSLTWDDENYYLIAYEEESNKIKHYRVDKMQNISRCEEKRIGKENFDQFNLAEFAKKTFGMYGGKDEHVTLRCRNFLAGVIIDRFGTDVMMVPEGNDYFHVNVLVSVSQQFFGWVTGIGEHMEIIEPASVRNQYQKHLQTLMDKYKGE
ncbi:MAG: WYL domain-containing protein [Lachnospiraceae bacterium]|nr:WYL domain-containing protein [Lachnospiraceae bacterium]